MDGSFFFFFFLFGLLVYWEEHLVSPLAQEANTLYLKLNKICLTHHLLCFHFCGLCIMTNEELFGVIPIDECYLTAIYKEWLSI